MSIAGSQPQTVADRGFRRSRQGPQRPEGSAGQRAIAREILDDNKHSLGEVARVLSIGRATIYRTLAQPQARA